MFFTHLPSGGSGKNSGLTPQWSERLAQRARDLRHDIWLRAFGEEEPGALGEVLRARNSFVTFQRWSPLVVPLVIGGSTLALALVFTLRDMAGPYTLATEGGAGAVVAVAVVVTACLGALLYLMPNDALWLGTLFAGSTLLVAIMGGVVFGVLAGIMPIGLVAFLSFLYARAHLQAGAEGTIVLTTRKGRYLRT
ncbi:MAG: hypothetical protein IVW57_14610, partial [Ktedonobacterales bacterium]|nr:hypothetical protein [Ktedonobacterales bacterium]